MNIYRKYFTKRWEIKLPRYMYFLIMLVGQVSFISAQTVLTFNEYINEVKNTNPDIQSANLAINSLSNKILEMDMVYSPILSGNCNFIDDKSGPTYGSTLQTKKMTTNTLNLNLFQKYRTGSTFTVGYSYTEATLDLLVPYALYGPYLPPVSKFTGYEIKPFVRIEQSLLRDFMSQLTNAGIKKSKFNVLSGQYLLTYKIQQLLFKARSIYLRLSLSREILNFRQEEVTRAEKILNWTENRVRLDLAEKSDLLQVKALYRLRKLNLQMAIEDEKNTSREFNEMLGISSDTINMQLEKLSDLISFCNSISSITYTGDRADVLAAKATYASAQYAKTETDFRSLPELNIFAMYSLHGLDLVYNDAMKQITNADKPTYILGLNLLVPFDIFTLTKVRQGYALDYQSAKESLLNAELTQKKDWARLIDNWNNVKQRLALAQEIKDIQSERLAEDQTKYERGRTLMIQLLNAENDLDDATINVYRLMLEQLITYYQTELYNIKPLTWLK